MSNYCKMTVHPETKQLVMAEWLDDYFGPHQYGVRFPASPDNIGGDVFHEDEVRTNKAPPRAKKNSMPFKSQDLVITKEPDKNSESTPLELVDDAQNETQVRVPAKPVMKPKEYAGAGSTKTSKKNLDHINEKRELEISKPKPKISLSMDESQTLSLLAQASGALEDLSLSTETKACPYKSLAIKEAIKIIKNVIMLYDVM